MNENALTRPSPCTIDPDLGRCVAYRPGHQMHCIHAKKTGEEPWGWRDGAIATITPDGWLEIDYTAEPGHVVAFHHADLTALLAPGDAVRVHEGYHALESRIGWINLWVGPGLGPVPEPADPALWRDEMSVPVTDLATGRAIPIDRRSIPGDR